MSRRRRWTVLGSVALALAGVPILLWFGLTRQPRFYRDRVALPPARRHEEAQKFVAQSLQLRNDIANEPNWQAAFSDQEVNAWLAEDLMGHFADQVPAGIRDPMVAFEADRVTLAFEMEEGPVRSVVSIVARARVPEPNVVALTIDKVRAGVLPLSPLKFVDRINDAARRHGLEVRWEKDGMSPVALFRYTPDRRRRDVILEDVRILDGQILLAGRSAKIRGVAAMTLPRRRVLQSAFPTRNSQRDDPPPPPAPTRQSDTSPES